MGVDETVEIEESLVFGSSVLFGAALKMQKNIDITIITISITDTIFCVLLFLSERFSLTSFDSEFFAFLSLLLAFTEKTVKKIGKIKNTSANMNNQGLEFEVRFRNDPSAEFQYTISANIGTYKTKLTELPENVINKYPGDGGVKEE